jgi:hypothetical protein
MEVIIRGLLENFALTLPAPGFVVAAIAIARLPRPRTVGAAANVTLSYFCLFAIGFTYFVNFVMHVFFGDVAAAFIGWADSPFQREVGFASLGFAVVGFLAFRGARAMRIAAVVGPACFTLGAAAGHVLEIVRAGNLAPGNAGVMLYMDVLLPAAGFALLWLSRPGRE